MPEESKIDQRLRTLEERIAKPSSAPPPEALSKTGALDIVGRAKEWLTREPPPGSRSLVGETELPGRILRGAERWFLPGSTSEALQFAATLPFGGSWITGPLKRIPAAGLTAGGVAYAQGKPWGEIGSEALKAAATQAGGELIPAGLGAWLAQRRGGRLLREAESLLQHDEQAFKEATAAHRAGEAQRLREARAQYQEEREASRRAHKAAVEHQQATYKAEVARAEADLGQATRQWESEGAATIADAYKAEVPAWKEFPSTERGLVDIVYGSGPRRLSESYDVAMNEIRESGRGVPVEIAAADAQRLGFSVGEKSIGKPEAQLVDREDLSTAFVMADELATRAQGRWKTDRGLYRRVVGALDRAGIGDPEARAEYRAGQSLIQFADKSKMLRGGRFNPEAARQALTVLKTVDELRVRGAGHVFEGPISDVAHRARPVARAVAEPAPIPEPPFAAFRRPLPTPAPLPPAPRTAKGVKVRTLPKVSFWEGLALGEVPLLISGLATGQYRYAPAGIIGGLAAKALSQRRVVTGVPLTQAERFALRVAPTALAEGARSATGP